MIATENKTVFHAAKNGLHAATISLDTRGAGIVELPAVNRAPEVRVEFEIGAAPLALHRAKKRLDVLLRLRVRAVEYVPWSTTPAAERHSIRAQRFAVAVFDEPVRVLLKHVRLLFGNKRRDPDRRFETSLADLFQHALHV